MILHGYFDDTAASGLRAFTSNKKARTARAAQFKRGDYPEMFKIDIGVLTHQKAADLLTGTNFAEHWEDVK